MSGRRAHHPIQAHMWGDNDRQWGAMGDKMSGRRTHHPIQASMWKTTGKHWEARGRQDTEKANTLSNTGTHVGRQRETSGDKVPGRRTHQPTRGNKKGDTGRQRETR